MCWHVLQGGVKIEDIGGPNKVISGFHSELFGKPLEVSLRPCQLQCNHQIGGPHSHLQDGVLVASDTTNAAWEAEAAKPSAMAGRIGCTDHSWAKVATAAATSATTVRR